MTFRSRPFNTIASIFSKHALSDSEKFLSRKPITLMVLTKKARSFLSVIKEVALILSTD